MEVMPPMEASCGGKGLMSRGVWPLLMVLYMAPIPPAKPTRKRTEASAGEKRTWRNHAVGSNASRWYHARCCSAVSSDSCSRMRAAARKLADGSSTGNAFICI
jgi:hypothetical protein